MKPTTNDLRIEHVPIDSIHPSPQNPCTISAEQMAALERSIAEFGSVATATPRLRSTAWT